jgi:hypothetical protein
VQSSNSGSRSSGDTGSIEDYAAQLKRERKEDARHYLKPHRTQILICWGAVAWAVIIAVGLNIGAGMLLALPPVIYLTSIYKLAYSPGHRVSRGMAFRVVFLGIPLALFYVAIAGDLI